nr:transmembrane emp24 domain-containing protein 5-like [Cherax quadricarinatus]
MAGVCLILATCFLLPVLSLATLEDWSFDNAPGIAMEYKIHLDAGKEDCYYQYVHPGATLYINVQVLKGGDGMAGVAVRNPKGEIVHPYTWKKSAEYEEVSQTGGYYGVCIDNQFSRFAAKLINFYMTTFRYDLWEKFNKELEDMDISHLSFTVSHTCSISNSSLGGMIAIKCAMARPQFFTGVVLMGPLIKVNFC